MQTMSKWATLLCVVPILIMACGGGGGSASFSSGDGTLQINLTDSPGDYLSVLVTIVGIFAIVDGSGPIPLDFADFSSPAIIEETEDSVTVDLILLSNEEPIEFALGDLPKGKLNQIRLIISESSLVAYEDVVGIDGPDPGDDIEHVEAEFTVKVPSGPQTGVKLNPRDVRIQTGSLISLTLDFDADKSIVRLGGADKSKRKFHFILKPVIFILEATGSIAVDTETMALGLNFPTGVQCAENVGGDSIIGEGNVLVANAGASGKNSDTILDIDVSGPTPVDATTLVPFASSADVVEVKPGLFEPLVNAPSGVAQYLDLVWISNPASVVFDDAGTVSEIHTNGDFSAIFIDNAPPSDSLQGLVATSGIEFGRFGDEAIVFQTNGNGSVTGIDLKNSRIFDVLPPGTFTNPSDVAVIPNPTFPSGPTGPVIGWLYITDASTNELAIVSLTTTGGDVGEKSTWINTAIQGSVDYDFASEPVGIAFSTGSGRLYMANRGNGTIIALKPDGAEIETYDTGLGGDTLNGIDVTRDGTVDVIFVTNTAGNDDPSNDAPGVGMSSLEKVVIHLP